MAKKKKKNRKTLVAFLLDETGSMKRFQDTTVSGYNEYLDDLRTEKNFSMMLTRFNSAKMETIGPAPTKDMKALEFDDYRPQHTTPLYDAIGHIISLASVHAEDAVLCVIMTDGLENASNEHNKDSIFKMISKKQEEGWQFAFLGSNQNAWAVGTSLGVPGKSTLTYDQGKTGETFNVVSAATRSYAAGDSVPKSAFFTDDDREKVRPKNVSKS